MKGIFTFLDSDNNEIKRVGINKLSYKSEKIIDKSIEVFNDNDPCIIHSTYCINMLAMELLNQLDNVCMDVAEFYFSVSECPEIISELVDFNEQVKFVRII